MIKKELIDEVSNKTSLSKMVVRKILETAFSQIKSSVSDGQNVTLVGFGTFSKKTRKGRLVKIPTTGEKIRIKNKNVIKFVAGKGFKDMVQKFKK